MRRRQLWVVDKNFKGQGRARRARRIDSMWDVRVKATIRSKRRPLPPLFNPSAGPRRKVCRRLLVLFYSLLAEPNEERSDEVAVGRVGVLGKFAVGPIYVNLKHNVSKTSPNVPRFQYQGG